MLSVVFLWTELLWLRAVLFPTPNLSPWTNSFKPPFDGYLITNTKNNTLCRRWEAREMVANHESFILDLKKEREGGKPCFLNSSQSGFPDKPVWWASGTRSQLPREKVAITHASLDFFDRRSHSAEPGVSTSLLRLALAFLNWSRMLWSLVAPLSRHRL